MLLLVLVRPGGMDALMLLMMMMQTKTRRAGGAKGLVVLWCGVRGVRLAMRTRHTRCVGVAFMCPRRSPVASMFLACSRRAFFAKLLER